MLKWSIIATNTDRVEALPPDVPKLYLKLANDQEYSQSQQDTMIANLAPQDIEILQTGHLPMLSSPNELRDILHSYLAKWELD